MEQNPGTVAERPTPKDRNPSLLLLVVAAHQRLGRLVDRELSADGAESSDYALLSLLGVRGPLRLTEVAAALGMRITDAATNAVVGSVKVGAGPFVVTEIRGEAWVPSWRGNAVWRLRP